MKTLRRILLWIVILIVLGLCCWGLVLYLDWPTWMAIVLFLGLVGSYVLVRFLYRLYVVIRVRSTLTMQTVAQKRQEQLISPESRLRGKWRNAVATLKASSLRRLGNPLYVLPWYLVIGKSGAGKTTALTRARLSSPIQQVRQSDILTQTENYDWWFFDEAIVLDSAGRYVGAEDLDQDRKEWNISLDLLANYRSKEGINGLVLAISADRLTSPDHDLLAEEGQIIRQRIDQLIRLFGKRFPIYILVTKCDLLYGFEGWATALPREALKQALGYLDSQALIEPEDEEIPPASGYEGKFIGTAMAAIGERLRALRLALVAKNPNAGSDLLLFPNELATLREGLEAFVQAALGSHPYLETPLLRGLFFSSGQQSGGATSRIVDQLLPPSPVHGTTNSGLFLHDFFGRILPRDRNIGLPALSKNPWIKVTEHIGLLAWLLLTTAIGILLTAGFVRNLGTLEIIEQNYPFQASYGGDMEKDLVPLQKSLNTLAQVERRNQHKLGTFLALTTHMSNLEETLKNKFISDFRKYVLTEADIYYSNNLASLRKSDPKNLFAPTLLNHIRYINQIQARQKGADYDDLAAMPQRRYTDTTLSENSFNQLKSLHLAVLAWTPPNDPYLEKTVLSEQALLNEYAYSDPPFVWLSGLMENNSRVKPVTAADFWAVAAARPNIPIGSNRSVPAMYTLAGKDEIDRFFAEMQNSVDEGRKFLSKRNAFEQWYSEQRLDNWQAFMNAFPDVDRKELGEAAWRTELGDIIGNKSAYFQAIDRLVAEFSKAPSGSLPNWIVFAQQFSQLRKQATAIPVGSSKQLVATINAVGGKAIQETVSGEPSAGQKTVTSHLAAVNALRTYMDNLKDISASAAQGTTQAYQLAADFHSYGVNPTIKSSDLNNAVQQLANLKKQVGMSSPGDETIWHLIEGPQRFITQYVEEQASCAVQAEWESKVLFPLQTQTNMTDLMNELYGKTGSVWAFADGIAKPFLQRNANQYAVVQTAGFSLPFTPSFLPALNNATGKRVEFIKSNALLNKETQQQQLRAEQEDLDNKQKLVEIDRVLADTKQKLEASKAQPVVIKITAHPTSLNADALAKPYATILSIQCASGSRKISNFNFLVSDSVTWSPGQCGDVELKIKIGDLTLSKKYPGVTGLYTFLQDFRDGTRDFYADEFPTMKGKLEQLRIRQIGVKYLFEGANTMIAAVQQRENLSKLDKEKAAEKAKVQDEIALHAKKQLTKKAAPPPEPPMYVRVPQRVGMCWAADDAQLKQTLGGEDSAKDDEPSSHSDSSSAKAPHHQADSTTAHETAKPAKKK